MVFEVTTGVYKHKLLSQFQMKNVKETVISEFKTDFKKSCLSFSLNSTYTQSENRCGK